MTKQRLAEFSAFMTVACGLGAAIDASPMGKSLQPAAQRVVGFMLAGDEVGIRMLTPLARFCLSEGVVLGATASLLGAACLGAIGMKGMFSPR